MAIFFIFLFSLLIGCFIGEKRKIGIWWAFFFSLVFSPIIGLLITLSSRSKSKYVFTKKYPKYKVVILNLIVGILLIIIGIAGVIGAIISLKQSGEEKFLTVIPIGIGLIGIGIYLLLDQPVIATRIDSIKNQKIATNVNLNENPLKIDNLQNDLKNVESAVLNTEAKQLDLQQQNLSSTERFKGSQSNKNVKLKSFTFNSALKCCFIILTITSMLLLLPDNSDYDMDGYHSDENILILRYCLAFVIFLALAYRKYKVHATTEMLIYLGLTLLYQPIFKIKMGVFSPYVDLIISFALLIDIIDFKEKGKLINWLRARED